MPFAALLEAACRWLEFSRASARRAAAFGFTDGVELGAAVPFCGEAVAELGALGGLPAEWNGAFVLPGALPACEPSGSPK